MSTSEAPTVRFAVFTGNTSSHRLWYSACYFYLQNNYVKAIANWSMALAVSSKCSEHILLAQECVKASLAMLTNTCHLSWRADLVILEENICETTVLKFLLERDQKYDCCNRPRSTLACFLFS